MRQWWSRLTDSNTLGSAKTFFRGRQIICRLHALSQSGNHAHSRIGYIPKNGQDDGKFFGSGLSYF